MYAVRHSVASVERPAIGMRFNADRIAPRLLSLMIKLFELTLAVVGGGLSVTREAKFRTRYLHFSDKEIGDFNTRALLQLLKFGLQKTDSNLRVY